MSKGIFTKLGLVEDDEPVPAKTPVTVPAPVSMPMPMPTAIGASFAALPATPTLDAQDQERLKAIEAQIYATPSTYLIFRSVQNALGSNANVADVFRVLAAANPGVTVAKIKSDIDTHLGVMASKRAEFDLQSNAVKAARVDTPTHKIADLHELNAQAQRDIQNRNAEIDRLEADAKQAERTIADGQARFKLIEDQLSAPLIQAKQLLAGVS